MKHRPADIDVGALLERLGIKAEKRGSSWWACCPFHKEKTPSWRMRDEPGHENHAKQVCFGCDEGGSHIYLVMRMLGLETPRDAWLWVNSGAKADARWGGVVVEVANPELRKVFKLPPGVVVDELQTWPERARHYAEAERGITAEQVERWGLGYALEGRLRGRIVFPVRTRDRELVSYTGRAWGNARAKYLEPHSDEGASKAAIFGMQHWSTKVSTIVVCEGAINALAIERALEGWNIGALMGSHFDREHAMHLSQFATMVIASDPDHAGEKMRRAAEGIGRWTKIKHAMFPGAMDAQEVERELGRHELAKLITEAS